MVSAQPEKISGSGPLACWEAFFGDSMLYCPVEEINCVSCSPSYFGQREYKEQPGIDEGGKVEFIDDFEGALNEIGREFSPEIYIEKLTKVFEVIKPCLHLTATVWVNLKNPRIDGKLVDLTGDFIRSMLGLKYQYRAKVIWFKPSPAMNNAPRRPISAHEEILLFSVTDKYFYDRMAFRNGERGAFDVWEIPKAYNEPAATKTKHPARQNPEVARRCILLGSSEKGVCPLCRAPWWPRIQKDDPDLAWQKSCGGNAQGGYEGQGAARIQGKQTASDIKRNILKNGGKRSVSGWSPSCTCGFENTIPSLVYDPFLGSGTTLMVAGELGRDGAGQELYRHYEEDIKRRVQFGYDGAQKNDLDGQEMLFESD